MAKMMTRKNRTIDVYMDAGAKARLLKDIFVKFDVAISKVTPANELRKIDTARHILDKIISDAEDRMFKDYPELSREYIDVFYSSIDKNDVLNPVDEKVTQIAIDFICNLIHIPTPEDRKHEQELFGTQTYYLHNDLERTSKELSELIDNEIPDPTDKSNRITKYWGCIVDAYKIIDNLSRTSK